MKSKEHLNEKACWELLQRFPHGNLAGTTASGKPALKTLNHSIHEGALYFHGAARGEKREMLDKPAVYGCEEVVAQIPSYWRDPVSACPATTWYQSVQVHGALEVVADAGLKAGAMEALMNRLQPEGGHLPIEADSATYVKMLNATAIFRLVPTHLTGRSKVGHKKKPEEISSILNGLWQRGTAQDLRGMEIILAGNQRARRPEYLRGPGGIEFLVHVTESLAQGAADLLHGEYWNRGREHGAIADAQMAASAWIGAWDPSTKQLVGSAAAISNRSKQAYLYDIVLSPDYRGMGLGKALVAALLDHPQVRGAGGVALRTRDAHEFYNQFGFVGGEEMDSPFGATTMLKVRQPSS